MTTFFKTFRNCYADLNKRPLQIFSFLKYFKNFSQSISIFIHFVIRVTWNTVLIIDLLDRNGNRMAMLAHSLNFLTQKISKNFWIENFVDFESFELKNFVSFWFWGPKHVTICFKEIFHAFRLTQFIRNWNCTCICMYMYIYICILEANIGTNPS